jgi:hypothetical protein
MSLWSWVGDRFKDAAHGVENAVDLVGARFDDMGDAIQAMYNENPDAQAMDMAELVHKVKSGYGSADLHEGARVAQDQTGRADRD